MLLVFTAPTTSTSSRTGAAGNAPEDRRRLVLAELERRLPASAVRRPSAPEPTLHRLACVAHDAGLVSFLDRAWGEWSAVWADAVRSGAVAKLQGVFALQEPGARADAASPPPLVAGFAAPRHDGAQLASDSSVLSQACYYAMDKETPIHASTAPTIKWDLAITRDAVHAVLSRETRVAYAQITHPGHHAGPSSYGGFCFVNHAAVAARLLQRDFARVAVVDVDFHAGNGTMAAFWGDASVLFASLHADPLHDYPFTAGFAGQAGPPPPHPAHGTTLNVPLPGGTAWPAYRAKLLEVVARCKRFGAEALVVSLGVDTLRGDIVAITGFELDPPDFLEMGRILLDGASGGLALPTVVVQEGGYLLSDVPAAVANFLIGGRGGGML